MASLVIGRVFIFLMLVWAFGLPVRGASAQELSGLLRAEPSPPTPQKVEREEVVKRQAAVSRELDAAKEAASRSVGEAREWRLREAALLEQLSLIYLQEESVLEERDALEQAKKGAEQPQGPQKTRAASYRLEELDAIYEELDAQRRRSDTLEATVRVAEAGLVQAKNLRSQREAERRQAKEAVDRETDPAARTVLLEALREAELRSRLAAETVVLRQLELQRELLARDLSSLAIASLQGRAAAMMGRTAFTEEDLKQKLAELDRRSAELSQALQEAQSRAEEVQSRWWRERRELEEAARTDPAQQERLAARRQAHEALQKKVNILGQRLQRIEEWKEIWRRRFAIAAGQAPSSDLSLWRREAKLALQQIGREERAQRALLADARKEALALNERIAEASRGGSSTTWARRREGRLSELIRVYEGNLASLETSRRLYERLLDEAERRKALRPVGERLKAAWGRTRDIWRYEIATVDDRPITVGKLFLVLVLLTLGFRIARVTSALVGRRILPRFRVPVGASAALESITYYVGVVAVSLIALRAVNIPLTAFTLIGGALAIGIGFGSQNIVNNFISGLILLIERPIGAGDLIELEGVLGTVEQIGARSTRLRTFDNTHVLVPNSFFLENKFVNWTLSDNVVRGSVEVGVAYGSPTGQVASLLLRAARERDHVLSWPEPLVRFTSFGDNALLFTLYFWVRPLSQRWDVESALRFRIDELFREAGITIAFPQRDIHLDSSRPVEVRVVGKGEEGR